ncbi:DMT family transporter [Nicoliella sp. Es01]|uniref:DMT family transporter n=1 Tax=Nicoliella lavandulae TaxID=3082954 RepID=A0ABU8SKA7_9LACO
MILILGIIGGIILPIQTSINTNLKDNTKGTPFMASLGSFIVGTLSLLLALLVTKTPILVPASVITTQPWWIWLGGLLGIIGLTANVVIFPYLGAVQTVIMPILGQIFMSMLIDALGLFGTPIHSLTLTRFLGIGLLIVGILMVILQKNIKQDQSGISKLPWQIIGIIAGMFQATQTPINGHLGLVLHSAVHAAFISFLIGVIGLFIIVAFTDHGYAKFKNAFGKGHPWWIWLGGFLGALYVLFNAILSPVIGAGATVVLVILGNLFGSVLVDKYGLLGAPKKPITVAKYIGLVLMVMGVTLIKLF